MKSTIFTLTSLALGLSRANITEPEAKLLCGNLGVMEVPDGVDPESVRTCKEHPSIRDTKDVMKKLEKRKCWYGRDAACSKKAGASETARMAAPAPGAGRPSAVPSATGIVAAEEGQVAVVKLLLATNKVDVDVKDRDGRTPLLHAAKYGQATIVELLLAVDKVNVNAKDRWGRTPLSYAAEEGHATVVQLLLAADKVDCDAKDDEGQTPLSYAAENGHEAVFQLLRACLAIK